jgi:hypothetical protein
MAKNSARGSWDSNDKRTKAGRSVSTYHPHKDTDAVIGMVGSLFSKNKKKSNVSSNVSKKSKSREPDFEFDDQTDFRNSSQVAESPTQMYQKQGPVMKTILVVLILVGLGVSLAFWFWIVSLFK